MILLNYTAIFMKGGNDIIIAILRDASQINYCKGGGKEMELKIREMLKEIGIMPNLRGYECLVVAIKAVVEDRNILDNATKLYPMAGKEQGYTYKNTERAMRYAIFKAYNKNSNFREVFKRFEKYPSVLEFVAIIAEIIKYGGETRG